MSDVLRLDRILGPEQAACVLQQLADDIVHQDHIEPARALRIVCERAVDGDPLLIAAPGQIWTLSDDIDIDDAPARRLAIVARLSEPPCIRVTDPDLPDSEVEEFLIETLCLYQLESWHLPDELLLLHNEEGER